MLMDYILEKLVDEHYPSIESQRCIQFNSASNRCTKCKDICSQEAINVESNKIDFDKNLCNSCGVCKAMCPTQAIHMKGLGEENIIRTIKEKDNIVFSCSKKNRMGTLKLSCLSAFHPELLAALFILYENRLFYFNVSRCKSCEVVNDNLLLFESLAKAENFVKFLGMNPKYEIITNEEDLKYLSDKSISRRDLFSFFKKESTNIATQAVDTIINDKESYLPLRKILLNAIKEKSKLLIGNEIKDQSLLSTWNVSDNCNGCGDCQSICPNGAWKVSKVQEKLNIYHNAGKCYKCGKCEDKCSKKSIKEGNLSIDDISKYSLKNQINLTNCSTCSKEFVPLSDEKQCPICKKKLELRSKIASI